MLPSVSILVPSGRMIMAENCAAKAPDSYGKDIASDDIEISDMVTILWEIG